MLRSSTPQSHSALVNDKIARLCLYAIKPVNSKATNCAVSGFLRSTLDKLKDEGKRRGTRKDQRDQRGAETSGHQQTHLAKTHKLPKPTPKEKERFRWQWPTLACRNHRLPSALVDLTAGFEMGPGVPPPL